VENITIKFARLNFLNVFVQDSDDCLSCVLAFGLQWKIIHVPQSLSQNDVKYTVNTVVVKCTSRVIYY